MARRGNLSREFKILYSNVEKLYNSESVLRQYPDIRLEKMRKNTKNS
jgi:hypothetical protein